ncbi:MAG: hypothetical protein EXR98_20775 [Gemmataceae bacterium]|nr:hypothetical protein [Gemmataceae bacterium]
MGGRIHVGAAPNYELIFAKLPQTTQLNTQQTELIRGQLAKIGVGLDLARQLKDMPRGRFSVKFSDDAFSTLIPDHQNARQMAEWLQHDAYLLAQEEKCDEAALSCLAIINAGRAMEGELFLISDLIRIAMNSIAVDALERVLAQGTLKEETMQLLQPTLERESRNNHWLAAIRGERAMHHHLFENIRAGKVKASWLGSMTKGGPPTPQDWLFDLFPSTLLKHYPDHLRHMNRCVEIAKVPIHERGAKLQEWEAEIKKTPNVLTKLLAPALAKVHMAESRSQSILRSAAAALACERYRLRHKDWPAALDVLVKEKLLDAVPLDPVDGQPLRYRRTKEGVVIYSIGVDKTDNQGHIDREHPIDPGVDIGFRLWDPRLRRQDARPPVAPPEVDGPR